MSEEGFYGKDVLAISTKLYPYLNYPIGLFEIDGALRVWLMLHHLDELKRVIPDEVLKPDWLEKALAEKK